MDSWLYRWAKSCCLLVLLSGVQRADLASSASCQYSPLLFLFLLNNSELATVQNMSPHRFGSECSFFPICKFKSQSFSSGQTAWWSVHVMIAQSQCIVLPDALLVLLPVRVEAFAVTAFLCIHHLQMTEFWTDRLYCRLSSAWQTTCKCRLKMWIDREYNTQTSFAWLWPADEPEVNTSWSTVQSGQLSAKKFLGNVCWDLPAQSHAYVESSSLYYIYIVHFSNKAIQSASHKALHH